MSVLRSTRLEMLISKFWSAVKSLFNFVNIDMPIELLLEVLSSHISLLLFQIQGRWWLSLVRIRLLFPSYNHYHLKKTKFLAILNVVVLILICRTSRISWWCNRWTETPLGDLFRWPYELGRQQIAMSGIFINWSFLGEKLSIYIFWGYILSGARLEFIVHLLYPFTGMTIKLIYNLYFRIIEILYCTLFSSHDWVAIF